MAFSISPSQPQRPNIMATRHAIATGHYLASQAGFQILEAGGNAIELDAMVRKHGFDTLRSSALIKAAMGLTSREEVNRVTKD